MKRQLLFALALFVLAGLRPGTARAADGDLVKIAGNSAVYYRASDGKRYVFPNDRIYFSWYPDFSTVREVDAPTLAALPLGGNVVYRPGTRLVKLESDPKVYAVEPRGTLRPLASESAALALYGPEWAERVDDLSDAFFTDYRVGAPLDGSVFPSGSVVRRLSDGAVLYVDGGSLRRVVSKSVQDALGIRDGFILSTSSGLSGYRDGPNLSFPEPALYDASQSDAAAPIATDRAAFTVRADALGADREFVMGAKNATVFGFSLLASSATANRVRSMRFRGIIDAREGGSAGFSTGSDNDDGTPVYVRDRIPQASLYDGQGNLVAGPATVDANGLISFTGLDIELPAGSAKAYALRADLAIGSGFGAAPDAVAFDIEDVARDIVVTGPDGAPVTEQGAFPNGGLQPAQFVTIAEQGSVAFTWKGETGFAVAGHRVLLGTLKADAKGDAYDLRALTVRFIGQLDSIDRVELDANGQTVGMPYPGTIADFENLPFRLSRNAVTTVSAYAVMKPAEDAYRGERLQAGVDSDQRFLFVSAANASSFDQVSLQEDPRFPLVSTASDLPVRLTELSFAGAADSPGGPVVRSPAAPVLRFTASADASGPAKIRHLAFKLEPGDVGARGTPDALENWAKMDGDILDDVDVVNLWRDDAVSGTPVGEGDEAQAVDIRYSVFSAGVKDMTPEGRDSAVNDYGLIEYDFHDGHELVIPAGRTVTFTLDLATDRFSPGAWGLKVSLLGGFDVSWTDARVGAYTPDTGVFVPGLPLESPRLTVS